MYILCFVVCKNLNFLCSSIFYTAFKKIYIFVHLVYTHFKTDKRFSNNISIWHVKDYYFLWGEKYSLQVPLRLDLILIKLMKSWLKEWLLLQIVAELLGRLRSFALCYFGTFVACLLLFVCWTDAYLTFVLLVARAFAEGAFVLAYVYTAEVRFALLLFLHSPA